MTSKNKDIEFVYNVEWKNRPSNGSEKTNMVGILDMSTTTLDWHTFKMYLLKNSGAVGENVKISYIDMNHEEKLIDTHLDFEAALHTFRLKAHMNEIITLKLECVPGEISCDKGSVQETIKNKEAGKDKEVGKDKEAAKYKEATKDKEPAKGKESIKSNNIRKECFIPYPSTYDKLIIRKPPKVVAEDPASVDGFGIANSVNGEGSTDKKSTTKDTWKELPKSKPKSKPKKSEEPPEWFLTYMRKFKEEIVEEITNATKAQQVHVQPSRKSKPETYKRARKQALLLGDSNDKDVIKSSKAERKLESKLEHKTLKIKAKKLALRGSSDSDVGKSNNKNETTMPLLYQYVNNSSMDAKILHTDAAPHMCGGEIYRKTWEICNNGSLPWTSSTELRYAWGSQALKPVNSEVPCPQLKPEEIGSISVYLQVPKTPGTYECYWHFYHDGRRFGSNWLGCVIIVDAPPVKNCTYVPSPTYDVINIKNDYELVLPTTWTTPVKPEKLPTQPPPTPPEMYATAFNDLLAYNNVNYYDDEEKNVAKDGYPFQIQPSCVTNPEHIHNQYMKAVLSDIDNQSIISVSDSSGNNATSDEFEVVKPPTPSQIEPFTPLENQAVPEPASSDSSINEMCDDFTMMLSVSSTSDDELKKIPSFSNNESENNDKPVVVGDAQKKNGDIDENDAPYVYHLGFDKNSCPTPNKACYDVEIDEQCANTPFLRLLEKTDCKCCRPTTSSDSQPLKSDYAYIKYMGTKLPIAKKYLSPTYLETAEDAPAPKPAAQGKAPFQSEEKIENKENPVEGTSKSILEPSKSTIDASESMLESSAFKISESKLDTSKSVLDTSKSVLDTSKSVLETSKSVLDTSKSVLDTSKSVLDTSKSPEHAPKTPDSVLNSSTPPKQPQYFSYLASKYLIHVSKSSICTSKSPESAIRISKSQLDASKFIQDTSESPVNPPKSPEPTSKTPDYVPNSTPIPPQQPTYFHDISANPDLAPKSPINTSKSSEATSKAPEYVLNSSSTSDQDSASKSLPDTSKSPVNTPKSPESTSKTPYCGIETAISIDQDLTFDSVQDASKSVPEASNSQVNTSESREIEMPSQYAVPECTHCGNENLYGLNDSMTSSTNDNRFFVFPKYYAGYEIVPPTSGSYPYPAYTYEDIYGPGDPHSEENTGGNLESRHNNNTIFINDWSTGLNYPSCPHVYSSPQTPATANPPINDIFYPKTNTNNVTDNPQMEAFAPTRHSPTPMAPSASLFYPFPEKKSTPVNEDLTSAFHQYRLDAAAAAVAKASNMCPPTTTTTTTRTSPRHRVNAAFRAHVNGNRRSSGTKRTPPTATVTSQNATETSQSRGNRVGVPDLLSGASVVASSAFNTAKNVLNMFVPPSRSSECGRWYNGQWISTNPDSKREKNLKILDEMGFYDRNLNATLLARHNDDLHTVIMDLLQ